MNPAPKIVSRISAKVSVFIALITLLGWFLDLGFLTTLLPDAPATTPLTAVLLILIGGSVLTLHSVKGQYKVLGKACLAIVFFVITFTMLQYLFDWSSSIELLLFKDQLLRNYHQFPGRPSPHTIATGFFLVVGFLLIDQKSKWKQYIVTISKVCSWGIPWMALIGYLSKIQLFYAMGEVSEIGMSPMTAISFMLLTISFIFYHDQSNLVKVLYSASYGGKLIRLLLPLVIFFPLLISGLADQLQNVFKISFDWGLAGLFITLLIIIGAYSIYDFEQKERKTFESLQKAESHLRLVINFMQDGLSISHILNKENDKNIDWKIIEVNPIMGKILGRERHELVGKKFSTLTTPQSEITEMIRSKVAELYKTNTSQKFVIPVMTTRRYVEISLYTITGEEFVTIIRDITQQRKLEDELTLQNEELSLKNKEIENFAYITSHDLQEPLSTIQNMLSMMREDKAEEIEPLMRYFDFMDQSLVRMRDLISGLLDYSRLGKERVMSTVNMNELIADLKKDLGTKLSQSGCVLEVNPLPKINGYEVEIRLLFQNMLSNAIKFVKPDKQPVVKIGFLEDENEWVFHVSDNGIGIKEAYLEKIFEIFQRLNAEDDFEGTGIGLAHCKKIVELHRGRIWVESEPDVGSTFFFTISKQLI